ncbi:cupin domain-containing protein [Bradyrhizobium manausense]|uniref:cupin domain-containing protein n=1 Tax=Bradyrhizobium manausense TaxID=989370 RepID=UPI001BADD0DE|nr:cupin domain-containing protein [Bradyrhizobium manausense]MBR0724983.1 cupin domain-containing protein [Bradyrhizobium manausense]MBR0836913.1 cupin domain-containing protein [Bradyrhizobium manausense]
MRINDDLTIPVIIQASELPWMASPAAGVDRRMLFRIGDEVARATSIVRYAPRSAFPRHTHGGGEEIVVLEGVFQDEHGDYPTGSYFRNPPGTSHVPASAEGCTIFVRLWQFREGDHQQIVRRPVQARSAPGAIELFNDGSENVRFETLATGAATIIENQRGLEALVLDGDLTIGDRTLTTQGWIRLPAGDALRAVAGPRGARLWVKDAPLIHPDVLRMP